MLLELRNLAKKCLSIVSTETSKDDEIDMWVSSGLQDLTRQGIDVTNVAQNPLIKSAVVMYVKANFGMVEAKDKELANHAYLILCTNLSLSKSEDD